MSEHAPVIAWLLDSDPSIRWQVMRDLLDAPSSQWQAERALVATRGWGARLLACRDEDGQWAGGAFVPAAFDPREWAERGQPWTATSFCLSQLREFGLDPASPEARRTVELIGANSRWEEGGQPYWDGEVEECINGRTVADGAYFGIDVSPLVSRLVSERLEDGGWNCERCRGSVRSSFASTINVLEGLLEFEAATGGTSRSREVRASGEEYLLARHLFRRLATGDPADMQFLQMSHPNRWHYDFLRALDYFRRAGQITAADPDPRLAEAVEQLKARRLADGAWPLDRVPRGRSWFAIDAGPGEPSRWITLRAMRVLRWWERHPAACRPSTESIRTAG